MSRIQSKDTQHRKNQDTMRMSQGRNHQQIDRGKHQDEADIGLKDFKAVPVAHLLSSPSLLPCFLSLSPLPSFLLLNFGLICSLFPIFLRYTVRFLVLDPSSFVKGRNNASFFSVLAKFHRFCFAVHSVRVHFYPPLWFLLWLVGCAEATCFIYASLGLF